MFGSERFRQIRCDRTREHDSDPTIQRVHSTGRPLPPSSTVPYFETDIPTRCRNSAFPQAGQAAEPCVESHGTSPFDPGTCCWTFDGQAANFESSFGTPFETQSASSWLDSTNFVCQQGGRTSSCCPDRQVWPIWIGQDFRSRHAFGYRFLALG